jgi:4-hydroxy-tetrahydrodipicolinate reductase
LKEKTNMNCCIIGYGKMGKNIERVLKENSHKVVFVADNEKELLENKNKINDCDVAFEFSTPETAYNNLKFCIDNKLPVVCGTTGWTNNLDKIKEYCINNNGTLLYAPNFSIGMNIFMQVNSLLAKLSSITNMYDVEISETHHIHKLDKPSGTAILLKNVIENNSNYKNTKIESIREGETIGIHTITYNSNVDSITFTHSAKTRDAFVLGAIFAATKIYDKKGFFELNDILK